MILGNKLVGAYTLACPTTEKTTREPQITYTKYLNGSITASIYNSATPAKTWDVSVNASTAHETRLLQSFTHAEKWVNRYGPLQFVPTGGEKLNLLTATESSLSTLGVYVDALVDTEDDPVLGHTYSSINQRAIFADEIPVHPSMGGVTVSAYSRAQSQFMAYFRGPDGVGVIPASAKTLPASPGFTRKSVYYPIPAGTTHLVMQVAGEITMPAVTVGKDLYQWSEGTRVREVVVEELESSVRFAAAPPPIGVYTDRTFRITQIGDPRA